MKILIVHRNVCGTTAEAIETQFMAIHLAENLPFVGIVYVGDASQLPPSLENVTKFPIDGSLARSFMHLLKLFREQRPDIIHIKSLWTPFHAIAGLAAKIAGVKYVVEPGGHMTPYFRDNRFEGKKLTVLMKIARSMYRNIVDKNLCRSASGIRALSRWELATIKKEIGGFNRAVGIIPLGFSKEWSAKEYNYSSGLIKDPIRVNYLGRLDIRQKGLDLLMEASRFVSKERGRESFRVRICGPELACAKGVVTSVASKYPDVDISIVPKGFTGKAKEDFFAETDLFMHLSRFEEMAKLAREATAAGVPVIASHESNYGDWVELEGSGLAVQLDSKEIAAKIMKVIDNRELLSEMKKDAIKHAKKYSWNTVVLEQIDFYKKVLGLNQ